MRCEQENGSNPSRTEKDDSLCCDANNSEQRINKRSNSKRREPKQIHFHYFEYRSQKRTRTPATPLSKSHLTSSFLFSIY